LKILRKTLDICKWRYPWYYYQILVTMFCNYFKQSLTSFYDFSEYWNHFFYWNRITFPHKITYSFTLYLFHYYLINIWSIYSYFRHPFVKFPFSILSLISHYLILFITLTLILIDLDIEILNHTIQLFFPNTQILSKLSSIPGERNLKNNNFINSLLQRSHRLGNISAVYEISTKKMW